MVEKSHVRSDVATEVVVISIAESEDSLKTFDNVQLILCKCVVSIGVLAFDIIRNAIERLLNELCASRELVP